MYDSANFEYFMDFSRSGVTTGIENCINQVFFEFYNLQNSVKFFLSNFILYSTPSEHPFLNHVLDVSRNQQIPPINSNCDKIFAFYLFNVSKCVNSEFFKKILKFVILYREYLNNLNEGITKTKNNVWIGLNYSQIFNANDVPDVANDFVSEFLNSENSYFGFTKKEAIEYTNNFCRWLYDNNYSCSKISISNS
jgi:hypothetical protein